MTFSNAVVLVGLLPAAVTAGGEKETETEADVLHAFLLTIEALMHEFATTALSMHPDFTHQQHGKNARLAFRFVLQANRYLHTCLWYGYTTQQKAQLLSARIHTQHFMHTQHFIDELYHAMATMILQLQQKGYDCNEVLYFMKLLVCEENYTSFDDADLHLAHWVPNP